MKKILAIGGVFVFVLSAVAYSVPKVFAQDEASSIDEAVTSTSSLSFSEDNSAFVPNKIETVPADTTLPVINNATLSVDPTFGLSLSFQTSEALDLSTEDANVQISYFTKNASGTLAAISNTMAENAPLVKDKTWDGYFVDAEMNRYSQGTAKVLTDFNVVPANKTFTTLVKKGFRADKSMDYVAITDWSQPATYVAKIVITDNDGNQSKITQVETTVAAPASVTVASVANLSDLQAALASSTISTINLTADVSTTVKLVASNPITINGGGHTISFSGITPTAWDGDYVLQVYKTTATLNDINLTGGNAALLVNGSAVTLTGKIDVSGNGFGGIEVSQGAQTGTSTLDISSTTFKDTSEAYGLPTIWTVNGEGIVIGAGSGFTKNVSVKEEQTQYYLSPSNAVKNVIVISAEEFAAALASSTVGTINIANDFITTQKFVVGYPVTINGNSHMITMTSDPKGLAGKPNWNSNYVLQVYDTTGVTIDNLALAGGDAALLVNGSAVTLAGNINVSGNEFGGIEVSFGHSGLPNSSLIISGKLVDTDEAYGQPALWLVNGQGSVSGVGVPATTNTTIKSDQTQYYITPTDASKAVTVTNQASLVMALADAQVGSITIGNSFSVDSKIIISSPVIIDGGNYVITIATGTPTSWHGNYVFEVYNTAGVTIKNINLTGGNAALYVNGSAVTLQGTINVSGNGYGGIEVSKGGSLASSASIATLMIASGATLVDSSEAYGLPTIWTIDGQGTIITGGIFATSTIVVRGQTQYYVTAANAVVAGIAPVVPAPVIEYGNGNGGGGGGYYNPYIAPTSVGQVLGASTSTVPQGQVLGASAFNFTTNLSGGSESSDVIELQNRLTQEGVYSGPIVAHFGPLTKAGVKAYQLKYGISGTGFVGSLTRAQLNRVNSTQASETSATSTAALQARIGVLQAQLLVLQQQLAASL